MVKGRRKGNRRRKEAKLQGGCGRTVHKEGRNRLRKGGEEGFMRAEREEGIGGSGEEE